jgi:fructoselysine-6-P-deglycase FrlB-like protein
MNHPPVPVEFLEEQLSSISGETPHEICFAREFEHGLRSVLRYRSLVVLATEKRPWRTRTQRLAASLRHAGYTVVMVDKEKQNA